MANQPESNGLLDVAGAASHLGVSEAFVRRLVLERRVRYFKVGKFVRFRPTDLDAFVEAGRRDPVEPWVHVRSTQRRGARHASALRGTGAGQPASGRGR
jgi:excisionase family DNA binding protein